MLLKILWRRVVGSEKHMLAQKYTNCQSEAAEQIWGLKAPYEAHAQSIINHLGLITEGPDESCRTNIFIINIITFLLVFLQKINYIKNVL